MQPEEPADVRADAKDVAARVEALMPMVSDDDPRVRKSAAVALGRMASPEAAGALTRLLDDPDEGVRVLTCQALGRVAHASSVAALAAHTHDESPAVRAGVLWALANVSAHAQLSDEVRESLFTPVAVLAFDPDDGVRADAAAVLGALHDERASGALLVLLEDGAARVRANACASIGLGGDGEGLEALLAVAEDPDEKPLVLVSALDGLARRAERGTVAGGGPLAERLVDDLLVLARRGFALEGGSSCDGGRDPDYADVRATAVWALGHAAPLAPSRRDPVQDLLVRALASTESWTARYAAEALARIHDGAARDALCAASGRECAPEVADVVAQALRTFEVEAATGPEEGLEDGSGR